MFKIQILNNISNKGLELFPRDLYEVATEINHPDAILLRSFNMHDFNVPTSLQVIARAGAGVNNIPVDKMTKLGIPVFNTPGANANAVKELVIAGMLLASRNICQGWHYANNLKGTDQELNEAVEKNKKQFVGSEIAGKTLGVIGLGAIGVRVANAALGLGMQVMGYDPAITVQRAWELSSLVQQAHNIDELLANCDFISFHVPLTNNTRHMINASRLQILKKNAVLLNFSREGIIELEPLLQALNENKFQAYVTDFPEQRLLNHPCVIILPHLGASTQEAEENCAVMAAQQLCDYLQNGNIRNAVNFPEVVMPRNEGIRLGIVNANVPNMVGQISTSLAKANINIVDLINKSKGDVAYTLIDTNQAVPAHVIAEIQAIQGIYKVRVI